MPSDNALAPVRPVLALRRGHETEFLPAALEVMQTPASPTARLSAGVIVGLFSLALGWSILGHVDIVATAPGSVIPAGKVKVVQPLDSGVVKAILVQDGDHVRAGQTLIELDVTVAATERDRLARDLRQARLDVTGLQALRQDLETNGGLASFQPPPGAVASEVEVERARIVARRGEQMAKLAALDQQIAEKQAEAAENAGMMAKLQASLPWLQRKRDLYRALMKVQSVNQPAWLDAEQAAAEGEHDLAVQQLHGGEVEAARQALVRQRVQQQASYAHDLLKDLSDARQHADELAQQYAGAAHKAEQTVLTAPIAGTVQQLAIHTVGGVVTPAQALLTVVPDDAPVLVEATVNNDDIGFVREGQPVEIKVKTFSFTRYGLLHGHVVDVSRDAVPQPQPAHKPQDGRDNTDDADAAAGTPDTRGYVAHVALDRTSLVVDGQERKLEPGMEVTAEIKTGRRRVISYLLSPLQRYAHEGMKER